MHILYVDKVIHNTIIQHIKLVQKRFYTRGTLTSIRISRLAKIPSDP